MNLLREIYDDIIAINGQDDIKAQRLAFFLDPIGRKEIYEYLINYLEKEKLKALQYGRRSAPAEFLEPGVYKPRPFICNILRDSKYITRYDSLSFLPIGQERLSPCGEVNTYIPLHILLPELVRPSNLSPMESSWFGVNDFDSRITILHDALKLVENIIANTNL